MPEDPATGHSAAALHPAPPPAAMRLRAVVAAGHRGDATTARRAAHDPEPTVRAAALGALARAGALGARDVTEAVADPSPVVRLRACQIAAAWSPTARLTPTDLDAVQEALRTALGDEDDLVAEAACWAAGELADRTAVPALADLARGHADPRVREAAVAALGTVVAASAAAAPAASEHRTVTPAASEHRTVTPAASEHRAGDEEAMARAAVLAATRDKPAVRRRAALALAAFEGGSVEAALRRLGQDRDWQVRQVAEELLGTSEDAGSRPPEGCG